MKKINDTELNFKLKNLVADERILLTDILHHIAEVDRRKLYLRMNYPSLFEYLVREIGYSAGSAQRRIDAARLLQKLPEVSEKLEDGSINLMQISKMQKICRQVKKESGRPVDRAMQKIILAKMEKQGEQKTGLILAKEFNREIKSQDKIHAQRDESVRVELTFSQEEMALLKRAQEILSNKTGGGLKETLLEMVRKTIKTNKPKSTATVASPKTLTPKLKKEILFRDQCCQYKNPSTRKVCGSKYFLSIDRIQPRFAQGDNSKENLRVLCKNHNVFRYQDEMILPLNSLIVGMTNVS